MNVRALAFAALLPLLLLLAAFSRTATADVAAADATMKGKGVFDVVTLNLWHDQGDWPKRQALIVAELARLSPDVIVLQEVLQDAGLPNQAQALAEMLGYSHYFASIDPEDRPRRYGNAILARHPVVARHWARLQPYNDHRSVVHVRLRLVDRDIDVFGTHLHHTSAGGLVRAVQIDALRAFIDVHASSETAILAGDFNAPADAPELRALRARFDYASGTETAIDRDQSAASTLNPALGHAPAAIDHILADPRAFTPVGSALLFTEPAADGTWASDHFGIWARLVPARSPDTGTD